MTADSPSNTLKTEPSETAEGADQFALEEGVRPLPPSQKPVGVHKMGRELSEVSKKYDVNGDGVLDETERAMRNMDKSNRGFITNERVYEMMKKQIEMQKQMFNMKRIMIGLGIFTVILALSNLATAFAAATLAKDTQVNLNTNALEGKNSNEVLGTMSTGNEIIAEQTPDVAGRLLGGGITASGQSIKKKDAQDKIWKSCSKSRPSTLTYFCNGGKEKTLTEITCEGSKTYTDPKNSNKVIYEYPQKKGITPLIISCDKNGSKDSMCSLLNLPCITNYASTDSSSTGTISTGSSSNAADSECKGTKPNFNNVNAFPPADLVCSRSCECQSNCCLAYTWGSRCVDAPPNKYMSCAPL